MDKKFIDADLATRKILSLGTADGAYSIGLRQGYDNAIRAINECPDADVQEVRHGKWEKEVFHGEEISLCSECRNAAVETDFCPNCGAKMKDGE